MQNNDEQTKTSSLTPARRWSSIFPVGLITLVLVFFAIHQRGQTGFFTSKFGPAERIALYLPILISMVAPVIRIVLGTVEPARLVEGLSDVCLALGSIWLRIVFPFSFAHFADVFPINYRFAFGWLNDPAGRIILLLQIIIAFISALAALGTYLTERGVFARLTTQLEARANKEKE